MAKRLSFSILALFAFVLALAPAAVHASSCGSVPSAQNSLTLYCIPITVAASSASSNAQVMLTFNALNYSSYLSSGLQNIYIYNSISGTTVPAWIEGNILNEQQTTNLNTVSNMIIWINDPNANIISTSTDTNYYIGIGATGTNFFISGNNIGEAPQLSSTYAEYDDGASVFPTLYQNFAGTSTPNGWTTSGTVTVNNGISIANGATAEIYSSSAYSSTQDSTKIIDFYGQGFIVPASGDTGFGGFAGSCGNGSCGNVGIRGSSPAGTSGVWASNGAAGTTTNFATNPPSGNQVWSVYWTSTPSDVGSYNYGATATTTSSIPTTSTTVYAGFWVNGDAQGVSAQWIRIRTYPPSGVMPGTSFGAVQTNSGGGSGGSATLSINNNPATYGQSIVVTATCKSGDTCAVDYPALGTAVASGTTTATYTISPFAWAAGTYSSFYANDITGAANSVGQTLTINKNSTYALGLTYRGLSVANGKIFANNLNASGMLVGTVTTHNNQLSGSLEYNTMSPAVCSSTTSCTYNSVWNGVNNWANWTAGNTNYTSKYINISIDYVPYVVVGLPVLSTNFYETATKPFQYNLNITKAATSANVVFSINGVVYNNDLQTTAATNQIFPFSYTMPLLTSNDIPYSFNAVLYLNLPSGYTNEGQFNSISQSALYDYIPTGNWIDSQIVEGAQQTLISNLTDVAGLGNAAVNSVVAVVGNQTINMQELAQYKYYDKVGSFVAHQFAFNTPVINMPTTINVNSIVYDLAFDNSYVQRSFSLAPSQPTFSDYLPTLVPCNALYTQVAFNYTFWNASNPKQQITNNVLLSGYYQVQNSKYSGNVINGTDAGLSATATSDNYQTCQYPSWATFSVNGGFQYSTVNSLQSQYYLVQQASQPKNNIHLYLASGITSVAEYDVGVENVQTLQFIPALVEVEQYVANTNSSVIINEFKTSAGSGYVVNMQQSNIYRFVVYSLNGTYLTTTPYFQAACATGNICSYTIQIGGTTSTGIGQVLNNMNYACKEIETAANTTTVTCNFNSLNGTSYNLMLNLYANSSAADNQSLSCSHTLTAVSGSLSCIGPDTNTTPYYYQFLLNTTYGYLLLSQGNFGYQSAPFADIGWIIFLISIIAVALIFIFSNPALGILGTVIAIIIDGYMGFVVLNPVTAGALIFFGGISAYTVYIKMRR